MRIDINNVKVFFLLFYIHIYHYDTIPVSAYRVRYFYSLYMYIYIYIFKCVIMIRRMIHAMNLARAIRGTEISRFELKLKCDIAGGRANN